MKKGYDQQIYWNNAVDICKTQEWLVHDSVSGDNTMKWLEWVFLPVSPSWWAWQILSNSVDTTISN